MDIIAKFMSSKIPVTVKFHGPKEPFALDPVELNKGGYNL